MKTFRQLCRDFTLSGRHLSRILDRSSASFGGASLRPESSSQACSGPPLDSWRAAQLGRDGARGEYLIPVGKWNPKDMHRRQFIQGVMAACTVSPDTHALAPFVTGPESPLSTVRSKDGTLIAIECAGAGPSLVIVHGGTGDRSRWTPLFPLFASRFRVCAMDRRGHGASGDSPNYSLQREAEDVAAVVNSRPGTVFLLGHSYGGVCALEAAFLTDKISKLVLYEPPLQDLDHSAVVGRMERMIQEGNREQALVTFLQKIVMISPSEIVAMKARPSWPGLLASIDSSIRQVRALAAYRFDPKRMSTLSIPTLLLTGSETASPQLKQAISALLDSLPNRSLFVFEGQQHNAMDTVPQQFAEAVGSFLLNTTGRTSAKQQQMTQPIRAECTSTSSALGPLKRCPVHWPQGCATPGGYGPFDVSQYIEWPRARRRVSSSGLRGFMGSPCFTPSALMYCSYPWRENRASK